MHAEEVLHSRIAADAVVLLHIATAQRDALGEPDTVEAVLELRVLEDSGGEDVDVVVHCHEEAVGSVRESIARRDADRIRAERRTYQRGDLLHARVEARVAHAMGCHRGERAAAGWGGVWHFWGEGESGGDPDG